MEYQYLSKSTRLTNYSVIPNDLFALGLSTTATVLYSKLLNRANLSIANGRVDEKGRIYILYRQEDLAHEIGKSISTVKINLNELVEAGLVEKRRADKGRANIIYVKVPGGSLVGIGATDRKATVNGLQNKPYKSSKSSSSRVSFQAPNNSSNNGISNSSNNDSGEGTYIYGEDTF